VNRLLLKSALNKHLPHDIKRKAEAQPSPSSKPAEELSSKRAKSTVSPSPKLEKFLKCGVVRGKIVKAGYFR